MAKQETHQCVGPPHGKYGLVGCAFRGIVKFNGQWYCSIHAPDAAWEKIEKARHTHRMRADACVAACEGFDDPMELRRRYDEAVKLVDQIAHDVKRSRHRSSWPAIKCLRFIDSLNRTNNN